MSQFGIGNFGWGGTGFGFDNLGGGYWPMVPLTMQPEPEQSLAPIKPQKPTDRSIPFFFNGTQGLNYFAGGFNPAPPPSPWLYWHMREYSAICIAFMTTCAPIVASPRSIEFVDAESGKDKAAENMLSAAKADLLPIMDEAMEACVECTHFGYWLQEIEWDFNEKGRVAPMMLNSVLPTEAQLYCNLQRRFTGFEINGQFRDKRYAFLAVHQPHIHPVLGYSRNNNARVDWWRSVNSNMMGDKSERKASGIQMMIGVPNSTFTTPGPNGNEVPINTQQLSQQYINSATLGAVSTYPLTPFSKKDIVNKPELANVPALKFEKFDWGNMGPIMDAQLKRLERGDQNIMRAWYRPERSAMQGHSGTGTNAEAKSHGDIGVIDSEQLGKSLCRQMTAQILDVWRIVNFGKNSPKMRVVQLPLSDPLQEYKQRIMEALVADRNTGPTTQADIATRPLAEETGLPLEDEATADAKKEALVVQAQQVMQPGQKLVNGENGAPVAQLTNGSPNGSPQGKMSRLHQRLAGK